MKLWKISSIVAIVILMSSMGYAASPERALENPIWLSSVGDAPLVYLSYSPDIEQFLAAYTEYDAYAEGHGGLMVRYGGEDDETTITAVMAKEKDDVGLGLAIHWITGSEPSWLLDLGASYQVGMIGVRVGVHDVPFTKWKDAAGDWHFSVGASLELSDTISIGIDTRLLDEPVYKGHLLFNMGPDLKAQVYALYQDSDWEAVGADAWLYRGSFLYRVGYKMDWDRESHFCVGIGFRL